MFGLAYLQFFFMGKECSQINSSQYYTGVVLNLKTDYKLSIQVLNSVYKTNSKAFSLLINNLGHLHHNKNVFTIRLHREKEIKIVKFMTFPKK